MCHPAFYSHAIILAACIGSSAAASAQGTPNLLWATYYGGSSGDFGFDCAVDGSGNVYLSGSTESFTTIAVGGHQNTHGGGESDAFLVKFNANGVRQWATYYGGTGHDTGGSCAVDDAGNVYLTGSTSSDSAIASGGFQNEYAGSSDAFLVKFDSNGVRLWATYFGGPQAEGAFSCAVEANGTVYLAGETRSASGIASSGYQNTYGGGVGDAFLVKFDSNGARLWATYYGGAGNENHRSCAVDQAGNAYLVGRTDSDTAIASGGHQNVFAGGALDGFLVKFDPNGAREWATYYGGPGNDQGLSCAADAYGNVYLSGITNSVSGIFWDGHQGAFSGGEYDAFLVKFNSNGARQWGTYYGGSGWDDGRSCAVDGAGSVYLAGDSDSGTNIAENGYQNTLASPGVWDAFLVKFDPSGVRQWGTYYGEWASDLAWSCALDGNGHVFIAGETRSPSGMAVNGHQDTHGGGLFDAFLVKFDGEISVGTGHDSGSATDRDIVYIWPNPNQGDQLWVSLNGLPHPPEVSVLIQDLLGRPMYEAMRTLKSDGRSASPIQLNGHLPKGCYTVSVRTGTLLGTAGLIIQ